MRDNQPSSDNPFGSLTRLSWRAVLIGATVDLLVSIFVSILVQSYFVMTNGLSGATPETVDQAFRAAPIFWVGYVLGIMISGFGGFVAGWLAREEFPLHGLIAAFVTNILFGVIFSSGSTFTSADFAGAMLGLLAGLGGGALAGMLKMRRGSQT